MKLKNNVGGFIFIETMIVLVVLLTSLIVLYASYDTLISNMKRVARNDDPAFIYRTYVLKSFLTSLRDDNGNLVLNNIEQKDEIYYFNSQSKELSYQNSSFPKTKTSFFSALYSEYNINTMFLIKASYLTNLSNSKRIRDDQKKYLKQLDNSNKNQWYLVVEYSEKIDGTKCNYNFSNIESNNKKNGTREKSCIFYYSSMKVDV